MNSALVLGLLLLSAFCFMMFTRRRILHATAPIGSLKAFDEIVSCAIREAGVEERHLHEMTCAFSLSDLRKIGQNSRGLMEKAGELKEMTWSQVARGLAGESAPESDTVTYLINLHRALLCVHSSSTKRMLFSAIEIIVGQIVHHTHYYYTYAVAAAYCAEVDIVESMADIVDQPTASLLRIHLS